MMSGRLLDRAYACSTIGEESDLMTLPMDMKKLGTMLAATSELGAIRFSSRLTQMLRLIRA
jgi:hypothetical protein